MIEIYAYGRIVNDVKLKTDKNGIEYVNMRLSSRGTHRDPETGKYDREYITVRAYGNLARICVNRASKGRRICCTGDYKTTPRRDDSLPPAVIMRAREVEFEPESWPDQAETEVDADADASMSGSADTFLGAEE